METAQVDRFEPVLTIGVAAAKLGISVQSLRLYEQEGLIIPFKTQTGRRMYSFHDIDRLTCIREMITAQGLNLSGIKRLMSMIPCWDYKGGLDNDCLSCSAYYDAQGPCWTLAKVGPKCEVSECRTCPVYRVEINCNKMKEIIFGHSRPE
ncbi:MAG: MerR family transcriptional regulator [Calditrichales bacterium]|nr:MAG: MerR family transcriptional regulator [Calditrichales bacterium]